MLALSSDTGLADPNVFVMGFAPGAQVERAVDYAHAHGHHQFAALVAERALTVIWSVRSSSKRVAQNR